MSTLLSETVPPVPPTPPESRLAEELGRYLAPYLGGRQELQVQILDGPRPVGEALPLPESAPRFLAAILTALAKGKAVTLMPTHAELTTEQATDLLNVSSSFVVGLLEEGRLPYRMTGAVRRAPFVELMDYKKKMYELRQKALDELTDLTQELNLY